MVLGQLLKIQITLILNTIVLTCLVILYKVLVCLNFNYSDVTIVTTLPGMLSEFILTPYLHTLVIYYVLFLLVVLLKHFTLVS